VPAWDASSSCADTTPSIVSAVSTGGLHLLFPASICNHVRNILQVSHSRGIPAHGGFLHARGSSAARERKTIIKAQVRAVRRLLTPRPTDPPPVTGPSCLIGFDPKF